MIAQPMGREIAIPFRDDMRAAVLEGRKCCTARNRRYGSPGDWFLLGNLDNGQRRFVLADVRKVPLDYIAQVLYREEGTDSPEEYRALWAEIHPRRGYEPNRAVWLHVFAEVI